MSENEFQEIGHTGGKVTFDIRTDEEGRRQYQVGFSNSAPRPAAVTGVWALPQGIAVSRFDFAGLGGASNAPPISGCFPVMIGSDSLGCFGHQCYSCGEYWRSNGGAVVCPYCGVRGERHEFLTEAQRSYVEQYCALLGRALDSEDDGEYVIDMDAVADAVNSESEKPAFYYSEQKQQNSYSCSACGGFNDILGKFGYCTQCGTRNDLQELTQVTLASIRDRANGAGNYEACVADAVGAFDTFVAQYVRQLLLLVPMRTNRRSRLDGKRFHDLERTTKLLDEIFGIHLLERIDAGDVAFSKLRFHRRHVYEHNGGVADEKYIKDSNDAEVRVGQAIRETQVDVHRLLGLVNKMANNLHEQFHEIFPPDRDLINRYQRIKE